MFSMLMIPARKKKGFAKKLIPPAAILTLAVFLAFALPVFAQMENLAETGEAAGLGQASLPILIGNIIRVVLSLLGLAAVGLIIYAGVTWATAGGDAEKVGRAKKIMINAGIGLVIVAASFGIASFIMSRIGDAAGVGTGIETGPGGPGGGFSGLPRCSCPAGDAPYICSISPASGSAGKYVSIWGCRFGEYEEGVSKVMFGDKESVIASCGNSPSWKDSKVVAIAPEGMEEGSYYDIITVAGSGLESINSKRFQASGGNPGPGIACVVPDIGKQGDAIEIFGDRFGESREESTVRIGEIEASAISFWSIDRIAVEIPEGAIRGRAVATVLGEESNGYMVDVICDLADDCRNNTYCCAGLCDTMVCTNVDGSCAGGQECPSGYSCCPDEICRRDCNEGGSCVGELECSAGYSCCEDYVCRIDCQAYGGGCNNNGVQDNGESGTDCGGGGCADCGLLGTTCYASPGACGDDSLCQESTGQCKGENDECRCCCRDDEGCPSGLTCDIEKACAGEISGLCCGCQSAYQCGEGETCIGSCCQTCDGRADGTECSGGKQALVLDEDFEEEGANWYNFPAHGGGAVSYVSIIDPSGVLGGKMVQGTGSQSLQTRQYFPVEAGEKYYWEIVAKQSVDGGAFYFQLEEYDENKTRIGLNTYETVVNLPGGWTTYSGTYTAGVSGPAGTKYIRPFYIINYMGQGTSEIAYIKLYKAGTAVCCNGLCCPGDCQDGQCMPFCGNGRLDPGEDCDAGQLGGQTCSLLGFASGVLNCSYDCTFDTNGCISEQSGNLGDLCRNPEIGGCASGAVDCLAAGNASQCVQNDGDAPCACCCSPQAGFDPDSCAAVSAGELFCNTAKPCGKSGQKGICCGCSEDEQCNGGIGQICIDGCCYPFLPPSDLTVTGANVNQIGLRWRDNSDYETGFEVYRSEDGSIWALAGEVSANITTFVDAADLNGDKPGNFSKDDTYYYKVRAKKGIHTAYTEYSNTADKTVTTVSGCESDVDCSGDTPCCNPLTGQCVENYGECGGAVPKSASKQFSIIEGSVGACLVSVVPQSGPWQAVAALGGKAFREAQEDSIVTFAGESERIEADYTDIEFSWSDELIDSVKVPNQSKDGDIRVVVEGVESNGIHFNVAGGEGDLCNRDVSDPICRPDSGMCADGLVCSDVTCRCQQIPGTGEDCDGNEDIIGCQLGTDFCQDIDDRLYCSPEDDCSCQPIEGIGESCDFDQEAPGCQMDNVVCENFNHLLACDAEGVQGEPCTCQVLKGEGEPCSEGADMCIDECVRFGNPTLSCDIGGIVGEPCTCQVIPGLDEPCNDGEDVCAEDECYRFENPGLFCDWSGDFHDKGEPCTCQLDPNIGIPCYEGSIAVLESAVFDATWGSQGSSDGQMRKPIGIRVDSDGYVYVVDTNNHRVQKFDSSGNFILKFGTYGSGDGQFMWPSHINIDASDNIYIADGYNGRIVGFDFGGTFLGWYGKDSNGDAKWHDAGSGEIGVNGVGDGELNWPSSPAFDSSGNIYVVDSQSHRVQKFDSSWIFQGWWGRDDVGNSGWHDPGSGRVGASGSGDGEFYFPANIAIDSEDHVYVIDRNCRIQKFDVSGNFITKWGSCGSEDGQFSWLAGLGIGLGNNVYVADRSNHRIQKFRPDGTFLTKWGIRGTGDGQFRSPSGIATDSLGDIYITDRDNHRIQKFALSIAVTVNECRLELSTCEDRNTEYRKYFCDKDGTIDPDKPCTCQLVEPMVTGTYPEDGEENICRNALVTATFDQILKPGTLNTDTIALYKGEDLKEIKISHHNEDSDDDDIPDRTVVSIIPLVPMDIEAEHSVVIKGGEDGIKQEEGAEMKDDYSWSFVTGTEICAIEDIEIIIAPPGAAGTVDWFQCAGRNDCKGDQEEDSGNQHAYKAWAVDESGVPLAASFKWTKDDPARIIDGLEPAGSRQVLTARPTNGQATLSVQADGASAGAITEKVKVNAFLCENPWPPIGDFPYEDTVSRPKPDGSTPTNFSTYYCRDPKSPMKTSLAYPPTVVEGPAIGDIGRISDENLIKEFLFPNEVFEGSGSILSRKGREYSASSNCQCSPAGEVTGCCEPGFWEYQFTVPEREGGIYQAYAKTSNWNHDLTEYGNYHHHIKIFLDDRLMGDFSSRAVGPEDDPQKGEIVLGYLEAGRTYALRYEWDNDYQVAGAGVEGDANIKIHEVGIERGSIEEDVIGIRVYNNPEDLPISDWYQENVPNPGVPESVEVSGYEALRDDRTVYVSVSNVDQASEDPETGQISIKTYGLVYLISYNKGASDQTKEIFEEMVSYWQFYPENVDSAKERDEVKRDRQREKDMERIREMLERYKDANGYYPRMESGTYVAGETNSTWYSWQAALGTELGGKLPVDPVNRFKGPCSGCPDDPSRPSYQCGGTCWNEEENIFEWPTEERPQLVYRYISVDNGESYSLDYQSEYAQGCKLSQCEDPACPENEFGYHCCDPGDCCPREGECLSGGYCALGQWIPSCGDGIAQCGEECDTGGIGMEITEECTAEGGYSGWREKSCQADCTLSSAGECITYERCGDGVKNGGEECDYGTRNGILCQPAYRRDEPGSCNYCSESCILQVNAEGPYCGDGMVWAAEEACDMGEGNGIECTADYGEFCSYCSQGCRELIEERGPYCGDGLVNGPEECDEGEDGASGDWNGKICSAEYDETCEYCGSQCEIIEHRGPHCGDGIVNGIPGVEQCDGSAGLDGRSCDSGSPTCDSCAAICPDGYGASMGLEDGAKIALIWGDEPKDLDANLEFGSKVATTHIYYANKELTYGSQMDVDDTNGNGPEIITINSLQVRGPEPNYYRYYVHNSSLSPSDRTTGRFDGNVKVKLFNSTDAALNDIIRKEAAGETLADYEQNMYDRAFIMEFDITDAAVVDGDGVHVENKYENRYWYVFDINVPSGKITERNIMMDVRWPQGRFGPQCGDGAISWLDFESCDILDRSDPADDIIPGDWTCIREFGMEDPSSCQAIRSRVEGISYHLNNGLPACQRSVVRCGTETCRNECDQPGAELIDTAEAKQLTTGNTIALEWYHSNRPVYSFLKFDDNLVSYDNPGPVGGVSLEREGNREVIHLEEAEPGIDYDYYVCSDSVCWEWGCEHVEIRNGEGELVDYFYSAKAANFEDPDGALDCRHGFRITGGTGNIQGKGGFYSMASLGFPRCGDGIIQPRMGETCDRGDRNEAYDDLNEGVCKSCSFDCNDWIENPDYRVAGPVCIEDCVNKNYSSGTISCDAGYAARGAWEGDCGANKGYYYSIEDGPVPVNGCLHCCKSSPYEPDNFSGDCAVPGTRIPCGLCGYRECETDYSWSDCRGQGMCVPGDTRTRSCWGEWGTEDTTCDGYGNCVTTCSSSGSFVEEQLCAADCRWGGRTECRTTGDCADNYTKSCCGSHSAPFSAWAPSTSSCRLHGGDDPELCAEPQQCLSGYTCEIKADCQPGDVRRRKCWQPSWISDDLTYQTAICQDSGQWDSWEPLKIFLFGCQVYSETPYVQ